MAKWEASESSSGVDTAREEKEITVLPVVAQFWVILKLVFHVGNQ